jgi:hypothetical protein
MLAHPILDHDSFVFHAGAIAPLSVGLPGRSDLGFGIKQFILAVVWFFGIGVAG